MSEILNILPSHLSKATEAEKKAFELTYNKIMNVLTEEAKEYLTAIYGDLEIYITTKIESEVKSHKEA